MKYLKHFSSLKPEIERTKKAILLILVISVISGAVFLQYASNISATFGQVSSSLTVQNGDNFTTSLSSLSNFTNVSIIQQQAPSLEVNSTSPLSIASTMRNANVSSPTPGKNPYIASNKNYVFSQNKSEISSPSNNSRTGDFSKGTKIAVIMPTFTAAAYDNAFYLFYQKHINTQYGVNVTTDLNLLSAKVTNIPSSSASGFAMLYLLGNLKWISPESEITFLTDQDVDAGSVFLSNGSNAYDLLILGHQEYVTQDEYDNLKQFVSTGGTMIILDGNVFYAEVKYDRNTDNITLVKGHSWAFNGISAWRSISERWRNETAQWVGSNYISFPKATFVNDPFAYSPHEEQYLTNPNDIILLNYNASVPVDNTTIPSRQVIATYELNYLKGKVIALGIYSDDIITNGSFNRYFDNLLLHYALLVKD